MTVPFARPIPRGLTHPGVRLPITVLRRTGEWVGNGVWSHDDGEPQTLTGFGIVYSTTSDELQALPEGEREVRSITCFWPQIFRLNDLIPYEGENFRVVFVDPWQSYGYNRAIAQILQLHPDYDR